MSLDLNFDDLVVRQETVPIMGRKYILREPDGEAATKYRNAQAKSYRMVDGKLSSIEGVADCEPILISACLYYADDKGNLRTTPDGDPDVRYRVPPQKVKTWPARVQNKLFDACIEMGGLNEGDNEEAVEKQIQVLQDRLKAMREKKERARKDKEGEPEGNLQDSPESTTDG